MLKEDLKQWIEQYLKDTDYELITLNVSAGNDILVEVDRLAGVDVDFCAELNHFIVDKIEQSAISNQQSDFDYSLEVGSVSLTDPFKTKMQFQKNLGHDVEIMAKGEKDEWRKYKGQLVSVDDDTFSVDIEEKQITRTWRYDEPKYVKYDLKF